MMYELIIITGTIFFLMILWTTIMYPLDLMVDIYEGNITGNKTWNYTINETSIEDEYTLAYNTVFFSVTFIVFILFIYAVKIANQHANRGTL